ncbi:MAG: hypothetical protein V2A62_01815 [Candidatus Woesearchaeota archaeon]
MKGTILTEEDLKKLGRIAALLEQHALEYSKGVGVPLDRMPPNDLVKIEAMIDVYQRRAAELRQIEQRPSTDYILKSDLEIAVRKL